MKNLTGRQKEVLSFISYYIKNNSYPPAIREIASFFSISVKGAHDHITALRRKGHLKHEYKRPRTMGLTNSKSDSSELIAIPILGSISAGLPILAEENFDGNIMLNRSIINDNKDYFALRVTGDSMSGASIMDGDLAIIEKQNTANNGEIIAAMDEEGATLKRFFKEANRIRLQSENPAYPPRYSQEVKILGRLSSIIRSY